MHKISEFFKKTVLSLKFTVIRFPIVLIFLAYIAVIVSTLIESNFSTLNEILYTRLIFAGVIGVFSNIALQFAAERFEKVSKYKWILRAFTVVLSVLYFYLLTSPESYSLSMFVRLLVFSFSLFALYLYFPSCKNEVKFGDVALVHFKSAFTSMLYGVVLFIGLNAIFFAIDFLLIPLREEIRVHMANIVFILFVPTYYLSLLPKFNSSDEKDVEKTQAVTIYPKVLDILVSYIIIPLISIFSVVLMAYFIKILATGVWPVGQVGPMVLAYSAAGLFFYILGANLNNNFSYFYRKLFPIVLIPLVLMQLTSAYIRIDAYGITEFRYYIILFGLYSITSAVYLIFSKQKNTNMIVLLSACFAIISIIPPVDAFSISRESQTERLEEILVKNNMIKNNEIVYNPLITDDDKYEITNITDYMARMGYLKNLYWIPEEYTETKDYYIGFEDIYGFKPYYNYNNPDGNLQHFYANLDTNAPINIEDYDTMFKINFSTYNNNLNNDVQLNQFKLNNNNYSMKQKPDKTGNIILKIEDDKKNNVMEINTESFFEEISSLNSAIKGMHMPEDLDYEIQNENLKIRLIIEYINIEYISNDESNADGVMIILVAKP